MSGPIVIHAGFHKTGTTSVQQFLKTNRPALAPHMALGLKWKMKGILHAARGFSTWCDPLTLMKFSDRFDTFVAAHAGVARRGLLLSAEELCGHMPGRADLHDYSAAPILMGEIKDAFLRQHHAPDLHFVFTVRESQSWLRSAYWEHVKSASMTLGFDEFCAQYGTAADFVPILKQIKSVVAPFPVHIFALEEVRPLGPAQPIIEIFNLPSASLNALTPTEAKNQRLGEETLAKLLALNREIDDRDTRRAAKRAVLAAARKT